MGETLIQGAGNWASAIGLRSAEYRSGGLASLLLSMKGVRPMVIEINAPVVLLIASPVIAKALFDLLRSLLAGRLKK